MQVKKYTNSKKALVIALNIVFTVGMLVCFYIIMFSFNKNMYSKQNKKQLEYTKTEYFQTAVEEEIAELLYYLQLRSNFETNNVFDASRVVDLYDYIERDVITNESESGVGYTISDLLEYGKTGITFDKYKVFKDDKGEVRFVLTESEIAESLYYTGDNEYSTEETKLIYEKYLPVSGMKLATMFNKGYIKEYEDLLKATNYLDRSIRALPGDINLYKEKTTKFKEENTNLKYLLIDRSNEQIYTNMDRTSYPLEQIKAMGSYVYLNSVDTVFESSFESIERDIYEDLNEVKFLDTDYELYVGVDESLSKADTLQQKRNQYENIRPWFAFCLASGILSVMIVLGTIVYLTMVAGYRDSSKVVVLNAFDKIKTEIVGIVIIALGLLILWVDVEIYYNQTFGDDLFLTIMSIAGSAAALDILFLTGYLSLIRRMRAKTLWKNSLLYWFVDLLEQMIDSQMVTVRVVVIYIGFAVIVCVLSLLTFAKGIGLALVLLTIIFVAAGYVLVKDIIQRKKIIDGIKRLGSGELDYKIETEKLNYNNRILAETINYIGDGLNSAVEDNIKNEKLKTDLITNVSHDIKTPLTSIINYVELLKREDIKDEKIRSYIDVLESKSYRLKHLTEDLVEASKISSGNIEIVYSKINFVELINQTAGEFIEKFQKKNLTLITNLPEQSVYIMADGRRIWRVIENLYNNVAKYAMPNTRVYVSITVSEGWTEFSIKNISEQPLNIEGNELTERFIRGDISRSTEGSGLGLSIAKNLTKLQNGIFDIYLDGDLFKASVLFRIADDEDEIST